MKMGPIGCSETSVRNYPFSLPNNPEEPSSQVLCGGNLKPYIICVDQAVISRFLFTKFCLKIEPYTPCPKKIVPFFIFFSRCPVCGEWCKLH
jgi:hypothetical protein